MTGTRPFLHFRTALPMAALRLRHGRSRRKRDLQRKLRRCVSHKAPMVSTEVSFASRAAPAPAPAASNTSGPSRDSTADRLVRRPPPLRTDRRDLPPLLPQALERLGMDRPELSPAPRCTSSPPRTRSSHGPAASHLTLYIEPCNGKLRSPPQDIQNKNRPHGLTQGPLKGGLQRHALRQPRRSFSPTTSGTASRPSSS